MGGFFLYDAIFQILPPAVQQLLLGVFGADPELGLLVSKALGMAIIGGALFLKVPQIRKLIVAGNAKGLALPMFALELLGYSITMAYNIANGFPFSTWGEFPAMLVQNTVICYLILSFSGQLGALPAALFAALVAATYAMSTGIVPRAAMQAAQLATVPIFSAARVPQILMNFRTKNIGVLDRFMVTLTLAGTAARLFTVLKEVDDVVVVAGYVIGLVLNATLFVQTLIYPGSGAAKANASAAAGKSKAKAKKAT